MDVRYARNVPALSEEECRTLQKKQVCVIGCGGLGGTIIELLARIGVGGLIVVDGDVFDETNLNRQLLATEAVLGANKAKAAAERVFSVNPNVSVTPVDAFITEHNALSILDGCDLVIDALDSTEARRILAAACAEKSLVLVHGAISGWGAQVTVVAPGSGVFDKLYPPRSAKAPKKGSLSFIAAGCACVQAAEAVKLLSGRPSSLAGKLLLMDFKSMTFNTLDI